MTDTDTLLGMHWDFTKIVATIGPASDTHEQLKDLILAGMNVARLNTKHSTVEWHAERVDRIRAAAGELQRHTAILLDLQGPEIRITLPTDDPIHFKEGDHLTFVSDQPEPGEILIPQLVIDSLQAEDEISIDDGICEFRVIATQNQQMIAQAKNDCTVGQRKTLNTPGKVMNLPPLIDADYDMLDMATIHPVDFVALSFVRDAKDVAHLRSELEKRSITAAIVAKIENQSAIDHLEEIIEVSDAVMVARGDLAVEIPIEELAFRQKEIIQKCRTYGKPVITATQMLKSMVENRRPTRAEVSDVANAVFDGSDAVMLSEETTVGKYPIETVKMMRKIVRYNEKHATIPIPQKSLKSKTTAVTQMAISLIHDHIVEIDKVIVLTETGFTAAQLVRHRPQVPIIAVTSQPSTLHQCSLMYAVKPILLEFQSDNPDFGAQVVEHLLKTQAVLKGEKLMLIHGSMYKKPGFTNTVSLVDTQELGN